MSVRLNDEDHRVHAALQLGGVQRELKDIRGTLVERFLLAGDDVTQSVTRLERAGLIDTNTVQWAPPTKDVVDIVKIKLLASRPRRFP